MWPSDQAWMKSSCCSLFDKILKLQPFLSRVRMTNMSPSQLAQWKSPLCSSTDRLLTFQPFRKRALAKITLMCTLSKAEWITPSLVLFDVNCSIILHGNWTSLLQSQRLLITATAVKLSSSLQAQAKSFSFSFLDKMLALQPFLRSVWATARSPAAEAWQRSFSCSCIDRTLGLQPCTKRAWTRVKLTPSQAQWRSSSCSSLSKLCTTQWSCVRFSLLAVHPFLMRFQATSTSPTTQASKRSHSCSSLDAHPSLQFLRREWTTHNVISASFPKGSACPFLDEMTLCWEMTSVLRRANAT